MRSALPTWNANACPSVANVRCHTYLGGILSCKGFQFLLKELAAAFLFWWKGIRVLEVLEGCTSMSVLFCSDICERVYMT